MDTVSFLAWYLEEHLTDYRSDNDITDAIYETFAVEDEVFGEKRILDLKPGGRDIDVTNDNKKEWVE